MKAGRASLTAVAVACARAVAGVDDAAERLVPTAAGLGVRAVKRLVGDGELRRKAVRALSFGLVDHLELRTKAIDAEVDRDAEAGTRQLVVLGAGLDARALRLRSLEASSVFEVDHPDTQALKLARIGHEVPNLRFVGVDFERDALGERLGAAGHDVTTPTTWIWEGVTMYLAAEAVAATLRTIRSRSAPGSTLLVTYGTPEMTTTGYARPLRPFVAPAFALLGEPLRGLMTPDEAGERLAAHGFRIESDERVADIATRYGRRRPPRLTIAERLVVARV